MAPLCTGRLTQKSTGRRHKHMVWIGKIHAATPAETPRATTPASVGTYVGMKRPDLVT